MKAQRTTRQQTVGFGCSTGMDAHHFVVTIPRNTMAHVLIAEHYGTLTVQGYEIVERCRLSRQIWKAIADDVQREFNPRLKEKQLSVGRWHIGENQVERLLGKELLILAWALEQAEPAVAHLAIRNWLGLEPTERWWLCTETAAATGGSDDAGRGWRKALYHIMVENPVS